MIVWGRQSKQLLLALILSVGVQLLARADELHLKDGRVIEAEAIWEVGDAVWYRQGKIISSVPKTEVVRIAKPKPVEVVEAKPNAAATGNPVATRPKGKITAPVAESNSSSAADTVTRKVARLILKGGTQIDADSIWEDGDRVGYRMGKMQTFVERADIERIVREVEVTEEKLPQGQDWPLRFTTGHRGLDNLIVYTATKYSMDPTLIYLVMREESGFNHRAVSRVGARGLMQLMPGTAARFGVRNIHDPLENVEAGTRYLRNLLEMFNGDVNLALAAYNAGENAVLKYGRRIPPYRETMNYVWRINTAYHRAVRSADGQKENR